jgi:hypothetical protein
MGFAADRAGPADSPDAETLAANGIACPASVPPTAQGSKTDARRTRLIRAWAETQAIAALAWPTTTRGYDARYAHPDMTRERASAEAAAAAAMARAVGKVD